jgi:exopolysaccharide biosynthesis predicted pyruvyltransferase EpsI
MTLEDLLKKYSNKEVYFKANPGNGGDALIAIAALHKFKKFNIKLAGIISDTESFDPTGKIIFYGGGGNLIDNYVNAAEFFERCHHLAKEIILLPHTINGHKELLQNFQSNITLFVRELKSYEFLQKLDLNCKFYLDHDLALELNPDSFVKYHSVNPIFKRIKILLKKFLHCNTKTKELNAFRLDVEKTTIDIPSDNIDISREFNYDPTMANETLVKKSVTDIFTLIAQFEIINTNRLHIAISAALLGKQVNFYSNSYWKNEAIYDHSIAENFKNVTFHRTS